MIIVLLNKAESELVVDQKVVCLERQIGIQMVKRRKPVDYFNYMARRLQKEEEKKGQIKWSESGSRDTQKATGA